MLVEKLADDMAEDMEDEECIALREKLNDKARDTHIEGLSRVKGKDRAADQTQSSFSTVPASPVSPIILRGEPIGERTTRVLEIEDMSVTSGGRTIPERTTIPGLVVVSRGSAGPEVKLNHSKRTKSCPPGANRSVVSGPWSLEWLHDHNHGDAGVTFSTNKKKKAVARQGTGQDKVVALGHNKSKTKGMLRHSNLKTVARLPSKDRREVLKILKKKVRRRSGRTSSNRSCAVKQISTSREDSSSASVNNDWKHWIVMHGNEQLDVDDVWGIGKAIGVKFNNDNVNMFSALARIRK
ncbi:DUF4283 domain protein, partial [Trifolium medium]|nr:DUF4283 domain protein [Trifolium medium]